MSRTDNSEMIRGRFREVLKENGLPQIDPRESKKKTGIGFADLLTELYLTRVGLLHVHVTSEGRGFWGYRSHILDTLTKMRKEGIPCFLVLLKGRLQDDDRRGTHFVADGYILEDWEWMRGQPGVSRDAEGDYKINERVLQRRGCELIQSIQEIVRRLANQPAWTGRRE